MQKVQLSIVYTQFALATNVNNTRKIVKTHMKQKRAPQYDNK